MKRLVLLGSAIAVLGLQAGDAWAQPGAGANGRAGGGRITSEAIVGAVALNPDIKATDEQVIKLRDALKDIYAKEREIVLSFQGGEGGGNFQDIREKMLALRGEMMARVSEVLSEQQVETLKKVVQQRGQRPGGRGGRNWGGGGGEGGGWNRGGGGGGDRGHIE